MPRKGFRTRVQRGLRFPAEWQCNMITFFSTELILYMDTGRKGTVISHKAFLISAITTRGRGSLCQTRVSGETRFTFLITASLGKLLNLPLL